MRSEKRYAAFTLIELMIAVCIIGVLASVALPTYQQFMLKAKGAEGVQTLSMLYKGAVAYWERPFGNQGIAATGAGHCLVTGSLNPADAAEAAAGMPPMPPVGYKRTADYLHNSIFAALGYSRADAGYFVALPIAYSIGGECNGPDGPAYALLAACDIDGDGMIGGYYLPVFIRNGELQRTPGYKTAANFMADVLGGACPYCASDVD